MKKVAVLLTVYNRKDVTLYGLRSLYAAIRTLENEILFDVFMVDDCSTDGTVDAVVKEFPNVRIIASQGNLFWGGGMRLAWDTALNSFPYDYYLWFNDDVVLKKNALCCMFDVIREKGNGCVVCGAFCSKEGIFTYGGLRKNREKIIPNGSAQELYYMNGNLVLVPADVVDVVGILDSKFKHIKGDYDYGLTVMERGFSVYSTKEYVGVAERNPKGDSRGRKKGLNIAQRFKMLYQSPFIENPNVTFYFNRKHNRSIAYCLLVYVKSLIMTLFPDKLYSLIIKHHV